MELDINTHPDLVVEDADQVAAHVRRRIGEQFGKSDEVRVLVAPTKQERIQRRATVIDLLYSSMHPG